MKKIDEQVLRATKEIIVKFIEMGRISPSNVDGTFQEIYSAIYRTVVLHSFENEKQEDE